MNSKSKTIFIIGYPGALVERVVAKLGEDDSAHAATDIVVLVRKKDQRKAKALFKRINPKASTVVGNLTHIDFGLSGVDYLALADSVTQILHLELPVAPVHAFEVKKARKSAREVIELAMVARRLEHVLALSHVDVAGMWTGEFTERDLDLGQSRTGTAGEDRFRAERIYRRFDGEIPITVARAGWPVGQGLGMTPLAALLMIADEPSALPVKNLQQAMHFTEIAELTRLLVGLIDLPSAHRGVRTVHLLAKNLPSIGELAEQMRNEATKLVPNGFHLSAGARRLLRYSTEADSWSAKDFFKQLPGMSHLSTAFSEEFLKSHQLDLPTFSPSIVEQLTGNAVEKIVGFKN